MTRTPRQQAERILGVSIAVWECATIATGGATISRTLRRHRALAVLATVWWMHHVGLIQRGRPSPTPGPVTVGPAVAVGTRAGR